MPFTFAVRVKFAFSIWYQVALFGIPQHMRAQTALPTFWNTSKLYPILHQKKHF